jgi:hypothetical protein
MAIAPVDPELQPIALCAWIDHDCLAKAVFHKTSGKYLSNNLDTKPLQIAL